MDLLVKLPVNVLTEITTNWDAWTLGYLKKLLEDSGKEIVEATQAEMETILNEMADFFKAEFEAYTKQQSTDTLNELEAISNFFEIPFRKVLDRMFKD